MGNNLTLMKYFKPKRFNSQSVILITGASSGIGKQLAIKYSQRSVKLVLAARNEWQINAEIMALKCQQSNVMSVSRINASKSNEKLKKVKLVTMCIKQFGQLDILILNAGITSHQYFMDIKKLDIFNQVMRTNFYGPVCITKHALPYLVKSQGRIVVISSFSGEVGLPMRTAYCASKFALNGFFQALRMETAPKRLIDIIIICPPSVSTNFRANAIESSKAAQQDLKSSAPQMSLDKCCDTILDCVDRRMRKVFFPFKAYLAIYLRPFFPDYVDKKLQSRPHM